MILITLKEAQLYFIEYFEKKDNNRDIVIAINFKFYDPCLFTLEYVQ